MLIDTAKTVSECNIELRLPVEQAVSPAVTRDPGVHRLSKYVRANGRYRFEAGSFS
jgi:hypothetical protein